MQKKGVIILLFFLILSIFAVNIFAQDEVADSSETNEIPSDDATAESAITEPEVSEQTPEQTTTSQEETPEQPEAEPAEVPEILEEVREEFEDAELEANAGITPDSAFYFVEDAILSRFRDDLSNREKKIAEIRAMIQEGNIDAARESLDRYERYVDNLERELPPEQREEARRSAAAIHNTIDEIRDEIPEEERGEFVDNIIEREGKIVTAAEIASKIKELCTTLSDLDPLEYSRVCKTEEDSPRWQRDMNRELTAEQEKEAKEFFDIMSQCFETSGRECKCEDISVSAFSEKCSVIAPLAVACDDGDEVACDEMEKIEEEEPIEDLLPDYLQDVLARLEGRYDEDRYDMRMPPECIEKRAESPKECIKIMFKTHAPEECQQALERGEISFNNEKEAREACDKIMFEVNAPPECVEAGVTNPKECGKIMFKTNAPQECIEAGITGENRGDDKKCREVMERTMGEKPGKGPEGGFGGGNCRAIQDSMERLECYDSASQGVGKRFERVETERREVREYREEGGQKCPDNVCDEFERTHSYACPEDCGGVREPREDEREEFRPPQEEFQQPPEGYIPPGEFQPPQEGIMPPEEFQQPSEGEQPSTSESGGGGSEGTTTESGGGGESGGEITPTGAVISNEFYDYYYR